MFICFDYRLIAKIILFPFTLFSKGMKKLLIRKNIQVNFADYASQCPGIENCPYTDNSKEIIITGIANEPDIKIQHCWYRIPVDRRSMLEHFQCHHSNAGIFRKEWKCYKCGDIVSSAEENHNCKIKKSNERM